MTNDFTQLAVDNENLRHQVTSLSNRVDELMRFKEGLRKDVFAAAALSGLLAEPRTDDWKNAVGIVAATAWEYADAMLKAKDSP